ncbi:MAG TPA: hypothetical protein EYG80_04125 [Flavobacteriaceae bacterium]|nr:hypothetical protein [Flavobacteriaceae bacterium]
MTFVIPMAGEGSRFTHEGYTLPKYMIEVHGKTLFEYSLESLPIEIADKLIFICLKKHELNFNISKFINEKIDHPSVEIIFLDKITRGQAETVYMVKDKIDYDDELLIYNIDTYFKSSTLKHILLNAQQKKDGILGTFIDQSDDEKWSFAQINSQAIVTKTTEKDKISNFALTGLYHFTKASDFLNISKKWIEEGKTVRDEFYIAPMYNDLISNGKQFVLDEVDEFIPLGTPSEVKQFESNN